MSRLSLTLPPISAHTRTPPASPLLPVKASHNEPIISSYYQESDIFDDMPLSLVLPDGITYKLIVKTGETVQEIKRKLDAMHGVPYRDSTLYFNGKSMIDPLSLNDFPGLVCKNGVRLDVKISGSSWSSGAASQTATETPAQITQSTPRLSSSSSPSSFSSCSSSSSASQSSSSTTVEKTQTTPTNTNTNTTAAPSRNLPPLAPSPLFSPPQLHQSSPSKELENTKTIHTGLSPRLQTSTTISSSSSDNLNTLRVAGFVDVEDAQNVIHKKGSTSSSISFVEYIDGPIISASSYIQSASFYDTNSPSSHSPPPLPNAFSDSPAGRLNRRKEEIKTSNTTTVIDVINDDDDPQCKNIHELGKDAKRWKFCFLF